MNPTDRKYILLLVQLYLPCLLVAVVAEAVWQQQVFVRFLKLRVLRCLAQRAQAAQRHADGTLELGLAVGLGHGDARDVIDLCQPVVVGAGIDLLAADVLGGPAPVDRKQRIVAHLDGTGRRLVQRVRVRPRAQYGPLGVAADEVVVAGCGMVENSPAWLVANSPRDMRLEQCTQVFSVLEQCT
jgi:hypothetical protein